MPWDERVAIVGLGGLFPGATTLEEYWRNVSAAVDASREAPAGRWCIPPEKAFDPRMGTPDRVHSLRGYFLEPFEPNLTRLDVDPDLVRQLDVLFHLALHIGNQAFRDAVTGPVDRTRVGVILGSIALPTDRVSDWAREILFDRQARTHPLNRHVTGLPAILLANALDLGGPAFTLDAACASSLYAVKLACDELVSGRADAMLAGGLSRPDCLYTQMGFAQLRALSASGRCSPLDAAADGLVVGEGGGIFVLKRLSDAIAHGDRIHGVIAGIGLSNDIEGNLLAPASEGQLRAMRAAYRTSGWRPSDVDLIECHATGTPVGDAIEFQSLLSLWKEERPQSGSCVIGSVKSTVGHLLTGANAAGLMKVLLAFKHGQLPPMANFHQAPSGIPLEGSPFCVLDRAVSWQRREESVPRRAAISGFGFGGINAHLLVEEWLESGQVSPLEPDGVHHRANAAVLADSPIAVVGLSAAETGRIDEIEIPIGAFPIPPKEMEEMLPQQLLMLKVAREALPDFAPSDDPLTGVFIGLGLDLNTTNFHLRWWAGEHSGDMDAASPPLNANRTMGALASIAASRIARTFRFGGPSFTISSAKTSGLDALAVAVSLLRRGEIDRALVGAVDLACDPREIGLSSALSDGATAIVLKRLDDATLDGDRVVAIIDGESGVAADFEERFALASRGLKPPDFREKIRRLTPPARQSDTSLDFDSFGAPSDSFGAANGLMAVVRGCLTLDRKILPSPRYWLHDSATGPRTAEIEVEGLLGRRYRVKLSECPRQPLTERFKKRRDSAIFLLAADTADSLRDQARVLATIANETDSTSINDLGRRWSQWPKSFGLHRTYFQIGDSVELRESIQFFLADDSQQKPVERDKIAFVYPGSGNHFADMGRELGLLFPEILDRQQDENNWLRSQYAADEFWSGSISQEPHPRTILFAQVSCGTLLTDVVRAFGIEPDAVIGYSLGESAGLFGMRVWRDRDEMYQRLNSSTLFETDLAFPFNAARTRWGWTPDQTIDWVTGVVRVPSATVHAAIREDEKAYVLIINTPTECVIGGHRPDVVKLVRRLGTTFWEVHGVTSAHCEVAEPVREPYRALHHLPVAPLPKVRFYSGASGQTYEVTSDSAADAILGAVLKTIDFPRVVESAYRDGIRTFVEIGPGSSCCRMIDAILKDRPHAALPVHVRHQDALSTLLTVLGELHALGVEIDLSPLYGTDTAIDERARKPIMRLPVRAHVPRFEPTTASAPALRIAVEPENTFAEMAATYTAVAEAHETFLRFSTNTQERLAETIALQTRLLREWVEIAPQGDAIPLPISDAIPRSLTFEQCQEFAVGSIAKVLGSRFAEVDSFPTRVRLPDGPLMLVDRILAIEGEPRSMTSGRVVTEHHVHEGRWYLDAGRIPTCVAVEAGQADLFLSGFLGIDFVTRGLAVYRLLDATVTFHRSLPEVGETIRYDITIDNFFRQGDTHLFRFRFECTVNDEPLLVMTDGCAGFFTADDLAGGKGIVKTELDRRPIAGQRPANWQPLVKMERAAFTSRQIDSLRDGNLVEAFGDGFMNLALRSPMRLPGGMLRLIDRVTHFDPEGGRFGLGIIRAEADVHPDDWFLTCHFVDDMVMPGTLMYECCMHALRVFLMRMGWIGEEGEVHCEPIPGITSKLKCRGQVTASTKVAAYEVAIKEIGYAPEPYAIADALMYADGKPIVEITNMSLRMAGLDLEKLQRIWDGRTSAKPQAIFNHDSILAFAVGKPSEAFGERYRVFDYDRVIARLPGPPYQFLDRITRIEAQPWTMVAGGVIDAEYDVPANEWYFAAGRAPVMPFSILLEVALQPCGWLAAYVGSALTSETDMRFRNLGGKAIQHRTVTPKIGTLTTTVKLTRVSSSGGMIIQNYDYTVRSAGQEIYSGDTYFGFFSKQALTNQVGLRECSLYQPSDDESNRGWTGLYPREAPFPDAIMRMVDRIAWFIPDGGPKKLGAIEGKIAVDRNAWFFKAHFYQDPVWPGSLGLESFLQVLRLLGSRRWQMPADSIAAPGIGKMHQWSYRGQVIPPDREVTVQAIVTNADDERRILTAEGLLSVDGRVIYRMTDFTLQA